MEPDFTAQDAVASLRKVLPWIALSPTFSSVTSVEDLLNTSGPEEASKFLTTLDSSPEVTTAPTWPEIFSALAQKIRSSCGREPPASWLSSETQNEAIRWLKFFQLALVHAVYCEDRVNNIETIRSELPDSAQRELMNQISGVQQEFFPQEADNLSTNPSPISFASLLGDSEQDLSILNNNNIVRTKKESFYRELERLRDQLSNLEAEKADLVEKTRELRGKLTDSEERALKLEYTVEEQTEKSEQLRAEVKSAVEAKTELTLETRALKDEMDILRERACRGEAAQAANLVFKERIARMEAEIAKREEQRKKLVPVTEAEKTMAILTESVAVAREEGEAYRRRASLAEDEVLRLRRKIDRMEAEKADWEREREAFVEQVRALKLRESEKSVEGAEGRVLLAEIEDFADDYEELKEPEEEPNRTYGEDDGFCDYDLNTSESSGGAAASGGNDSDYETCGDATPKDGGSGYDHPGVVATEEEAPRCVTVHHVKAEVYAPPATIDEIETKKLLLIPSSKFDIDPRETSLGSPLRVPKRPKRHGTPPKSSSAVRSAISAPGPFWNRRKGPKPGSESSLSSEPSVHYQDIKFTDEVKEQEEVDGIVDEASLLVADSQDAPDFDDDFYGNSRVSRRCRHEAEMMAKIQAKQPIKDRAKSKGRSKSRSKAVSEVILDVIGMCGP